MDKLPGTFAYTQADLNAGLVLFAIDGGYLRPYSEKYLGKPAASLSVVLGDLAEVGNYPPEVNYGGTHWRHKILVVNPSANALFGQAGCVGDLEAGNISAALQKLTIAQIDANGPLPKLEAAYAPTSIVSPQSGVKSVTYDDGTIWKPSYIGEQAPPLTGATVPAGVSGPIPPNPTQPTTALPIVTTAMALPAQTTIMQDAASSGLLALPKTTLDQRKMLYLAVGGIFVLYLALRR